MRIVEWNCQGAFRKKSHVVKDFNADLIIIPECEAKFQLKQNELIQSSSDFIWYGENQNKGIGIHSMSDWKLEVLRCFNPSFRYIVPIKVSKNDQSFLMFVVWAQENKSQPYYRYIGQIWQALHYYQPYLRYNCIIVGDFNSNAIWDNAKDRVCRHIDVVDFLSEYEILSLYHLQENELHGSEKSATFYLNRKFEKDYHIDYCFASKIFYNSKFKLSVGSFEDWSKLSDHVPLKVEIDETKIVDSVPNSMSDFIGRKIDQLNPIVRKCYSKKISELQYLGDQVDALNFKEEERLKCIDDIQIIRNIDDLNTKLNPLK